MTRRMIKELDEFLLTRIQFPHIKPVKRQRIETLINEETLLLTKYMRNEY